MRVHGEVNIVRRTEIIGRSDYKDYRLELQEDFRHICGYCGKSEEVTKNAFEIDHFVPKSFDPNLKNKYSNLVYSCYTCNRKKGNKWPTKDKSKCNDGKVGIIDPCSNEFDSNLTRLEDGTINDLTPLGEYICNSIFSFHLRPIKEIWLCAEIITRQKLLESRISKMTKEECCEYIQINSKLKELMQMLFSKKE